MNVRFAEGDHAVHPRRVPQAQIKNSTFGYEPTLAEWTLHDDFSNVAASLVTGPAAVWLGVAVAGALGGKYDRRRGSNSAFFPRR